jgi:hypothetical protein
MPQTVVIPESLVIPKTFVILSEAAKGRAAEGPAFISAPTKPDPQTAPANRFTSEPDFS